MDNNNDLSVSKPWYKSKTLIWAFILSIVSFLMAINPSITTSPRFLEYVNLLPVDYQAIALGIIATITAYLRIVTNKRLSP